jgi:acetyl-CoA carboxylase carboxyltransferase component
VEEYRAKFASPYMSASRGYITDVIEPADTRATIALAAQAADQARVAPGQEARLTSRFKRRATFNPTELRV